MFSRTQNIKLSPIKQIELLASKIPDVVSLAQGVPSFDTPEVIKKSAIKALSRGVVAKYSLTYGLPELRETIEQKLAEDGMYYDFEKEIIATAGSIEAITATLIAIIEPKKNEIILFSPSYTSYAEAVKVAGGKPIFVNLIEGGLALSQSKGWRIDFKSLERKINSKTAAILFCNPNNPTGTIFPKEDLLKIAELAENKKFFILSDEVYKDFIYDFAFPSDGTAGRAFFSLAQIPELRKRVIRIFSLSKAYAMTGWRIGFMHSDEENIKEILKVHDSLVTCAPVISQYAAIAALDFGDKEIEKFRRQYQERRDLICRHLDDLKDFFSYQKPNSSYFIFPKLLPKRDSWQFALDLLEKAHVAVVPGIAFGPSGESHIRMSFGRSEKDINEAMRRIKKFFKYD
ncbi:MAG: pyridoxal phosphate-dependent aminotransferase [Patescibacteria group bacterium]